jgi:hypothetical protein
MSGDSRVQGLLEEILESHRTPEDVCEDCPELLTEVRARLRRVRALEAQFESWFPTSGSPMGPLEPLDGKPPDSRLRRHGDTRARRDGRCLQGAAFAIEAHRRSPSPFASTPKTRSRRVIWRFFSAPRAGWQKPSTTFSKPSGYVAASQRRIGTGSSLIDTRLPARILEPGRAQAPRTRVEASRSEPASANRRSTGCEPTWS